MADKKLFPGVTKKQTEKARRFREVRARIDHEKLLRMQQRDKEEQERIKKESDKKKREAKVNQIVNEINKKRSEIDEKRRNTPAYRRKMKMLDVRDNVLAGIMAVVWVAESLMGLAYIGHDEGENYLEHRKNFTEALTGRSTVLHFHNVLLAASFLFVIIVNIDFEKLKKKRREKRTFKTVDSMLTLKEGKQIDEKWLKRCFEVVKDIISHMSAQDKEFFEKVLDGTINIRDNKLLADVARQIVEGHFETHPEDMQLLVETFDPDSLPKELQDMLADLRLEPGLYYCTERDTGR